MWSYRYAIIIFVFREVMNNLDNLKSPALADHNKVTERRQHGELFDVHVRDIAGFLIG